MKSVYIHSREIWIAVQAVLLGVLMTGVSQFLLWLIGVMTSISYFGVFSSKPGLPLGNHLGLGAIAIPVIGGLIVGLLARFGSPGIRGHGIPEAMQQVLENSSRIPARITWLKPLSAAISIGTGGPFGAEGPIIATGAASGSLLGQIFTASAVERKILLAAGAAAGMAATFGSPLSALLLAVELLLFEFKARSLIPVALAVGVASIIRTSWIGSAPVFPMPTLGVPGIPAFAACLTISLLLGIVTFGLSRIVYIVEDAFEKLPLHWMWWPALGGIAVGCIGYIDPRTLGVGYYNITANLDGAGTMTAIGMLCFLKLLSWSIALGSGTSGGTLAPLMTIGSALGWMMGLFFQQFIPGLDPHLAALIGMTCVFGGASQALLAATVFAIETTGQSAALVPLLACCAISVWVVKALGKTSIMSEKIERRGIIVPSQFSADVFEHTRVDDVMNRDPVTLASTMSLLDLSRQHAMHDPELGGHHAHPVLGESGQLVGLITRADVIRAIETAGPEETILDYASTNLVSVHPGETLHEAIQKLLIHDIGKLPVVALDDPQKLVGFLSRSAILSARWKGLKEELPERGWFSWSKAHPALSSRISCIESMSIHD